MTGISREHDDDDLRWYYSSDGNKYLSVTQVLELALDEDKSGLEYWKKNNQGEGDDFHHEHVWWYSAPRGTLCHYQALSKFESQSELEDMWGDEERESIEQMLVGPEDGTFDDASHDESAVVYSILKNQDVVESREQFEHLFADTDLMDICKADTTWFTDAFDDLCDTLGVTAEHVLGVEKYLLRGLDDNEIGYGGQSDLVYEDPDGNTVVADLKTSSSLRQKHRLQAVAYAHAVERADGLPDGVDRVEVWRLCPDSEEVQVHTDEVPDCYDDIDVVTDENWLVDPWGEFEYSDTEDMWDTFQSLVAKAHEGVDE